MKSKKPPEKKKKGKQIFRMVCKSIPKEINCIEHFLNQMNATVCVDERTMDRLLVSCTEAVNNAIIHGNKSDPEKEVKVTCIAEDQMIIVRVQDEGNGFHPEDIQDPRKEANLLKESGRGVFLIRSLMDSMTVKKVRSGCIVEMKIRCRQTKPAGEKRRNKKTVR